MAAPRFVKASTGAPDAGGAWTYVIPQAADPANNVIIIQILQDGSTNGAVAITDVGNLVNLVGSSGLTKIPGSNADGSHPVGASGEARQFLYICRNPSYSGSSTIAGTNSTSEDLFIRSYEFTDANSGTTLADVIENVAANTPALIQISSQNTDGPFGNAAATEREAQSFQLTTNNLMGGVTLWASKIGNPTDSVVVELQSDSSGVPSGTVLASVTISAAEFPASTGEVYAWLPYALSGGVTYWLVTRRTGALDASNYFSWRYQNTSVYASGRRATYINGVWSANTSHDHTVYVCGVGRNEVGTSASASDAIVKTIGSDRLALNFVAVNDDNAISAFTGETGGNWALAVTPYADSGGTDGAIALQSARIGYVIATTAGNTNSMPVYGGSGTYEQEAQSFLTVGAGRLYRASIDVQRVGTVADNIVLEIQTDASNAPSGTVLDSVSVAGSTISTGSTSLEWTGSLPLAAATRYWLVVRRTGSRDTTNHYEVWQSTADYADGQTLQRNSGSWQGLNTEDRGFSVSIEEVGKIDGGSGSIVDSDAWGVVGFALIGTTPSGPVTLYGIIQKALTFTKAVAGRKETFGQTATTFTFTKAVSGVRKVFGQVAVAFTFGKAVVGVRTALGQTATSFTFGKNIAGTKTTFGQIVEVFTVGIATAGNRLASTLYGIVAAPFTFTKAVAGQRKTFSQIVAPFTFTKNVLGQKMTFGQTATPFIFTKTVSGVRTTFSSTATSITVAITTAGIRVGNTLYGIVSAPFIFTKAVIGQKKTFGQIATPFIFTKNVLGKKTTFGQTAISFTFTKIVSGVRTTFSSIATSIIATIVTVGFRVGNVVYGIVSAPFIFSKSIIGQRTTFGQVVAPFIFVKNVNGQRKTFSQIAVTLTIGFTTAGTRISNVFYGVVTAPFTFTKSVIGQRKTFGQVAAPFIFVKDVIGRKTTFGQITRPITFSKAVSGVRITLGQIVRSFIFTKSVSGTKKTFARVDLPLIFVNQTSGRRQTFSRVDFPIDIQFNIIAEMQGIRFGQASMSLLFSENVAGTKKTFGQISLPNFFSRSTQGLRKTFGRFDRPYIFTKETIGQRQTFGRSELPINATFVVGGYRLVRGQIALSLVFGEQTIGQRKTFGHIVAPFDFDAQLQGFKETFGLVDLPIDFVVDVNTGRVETYSSLGLEFLLSLETAGIIRPREIILNLAKAIYLGSTPVDAVYTDSQKVWPT